MADNAIGMIETKGYVAALAAADAMVKAANVTIVGRAGGRRRAGRRDRSSATSARSRRPPRPAPRPRRSVGELVSVHVIPRPHAELGKHFTIAASDGRPDPTAAAARRAARLPADPRPAAAVRGVPGHARPGPAATRRSRASTRSSSRSRPALAIERVTDLALRAVPAVEPGILFVERQFGVLEVHCRDLADVERAGRGDPGRARRRRGGPAPAAHPVPRRDRGRHRPARGHHQPDRGRRR